MPGDLDANGHLRIIDRAKDVGKTSHRRHVRPQLHREQAQVLPAHQGGRVLRPWQRDMVCAFVNIDYGAVGQLGRAPGHRLRRLCRPGLAKPKVLELISECIWSRSMPTWPAEPGMADTQVPRFLVLHKELDPDDDELTRTRKVRRNFVAEKYGVLIDALYSGKPQQFIETQVKFEDGRRGQRHATLRIVGCQAHPPLPDDP